MSTPTILEIQDVSKSFRTNGKDLLVLRDTTIRVEEGRFVCIIGPSGCGKSTLFNIVAGLMPPTSGQIMVNGQSVVGKTGNVGYMLQKDLLLPWRSILDNVILGMEIRRIPRRQAVKRALPLLDRYGLQGFENHYPYELSGGMRQRVAFLRTLLYDRDILLLDEPFGALDAQTRLDMQNWLLSIWKDFSKTILFVTHDIDEAIYLSDDIYVFSPRPGTIKAKISVDIERPRRTEDITSAQFMDLKQYLLNLLFEKQPPDGTDPAGKGSGKIGNH